VTSSIFHPEIQHFHAFSMVHSTLSLVFPGSPNAMAAMAGGGTAEGLTTVEAAATAAETAEGVPLGLALPGQIGTAKSMDYPLVI
jgi:hypothetical protein